MEGSGQVYDVVIIGSGAAGLTAGIYALRRGLTTLILEGKIPGGRIVDAHVVENYPGFPEALSGSDLAMKMLAQLEKFGGEVKHSEEVVSLSLKGEVKRVITRKGEYRARAVILAMGAQRKRLFIPGEKEFLGKGVSYCATCDGPFFKDKRVVVVGSENEAFQEALFLADLAAEVYLVPNRREINAAEYRIKSFEGKENTRILRNHEVEAINGGRVVESLTLRELNTGESRELPCNGVFVAVGVAPITEIVRNAGVEVDERGWMRVDREQRTSMEGVYAAGDCTGRGMQVATAVGEGAMAAITASKKIKE